MDSGLGGRIEAIDHLDKVVLVTTDSDSLATMIAVSVPQPVVTTDSSVIGEGAAELDVNAVELVHIITDGDGVDIDPPIVDILAVDVPCGVGSVSGTKLELDVVVAVVV